MSKPVENKIKQAISNYKRGKIFFPDNFINFGSSEAVRQALSRLEKKELLIRLAHGIYLYPKTHKLLGNLLPTIEEIAIAISKRDKARIIPTGIQALNKLGLSPQVPLNLVYLTDGTPRIIKIANGSIKFKIASPKTLKVKSDTNVLVIQALREIGPDNLNMKTKSKVLKILEKVDRNIIQHDLKLAPAWISEIMKESIKSK